ncbi:MAG: FeoB-associated Cys-rich membrane protein [Deltaproteobacteria bacterium]|nr:FeoB-associated Cys-rich membrane protein [Deltaproteobacteria bacterium]
MENIIVIIIVGLAVAFLGRGYYKKYKKGNQCSCGCTSCSTDNSSCEFPEEREKQQNEIQRSMEN